METISCKYVTVVWDPPWWTVQVKTFSPTLDTPTFKWLTGQVVRGGRLGKASATIAAQRHATSRNLPYVPCNSSVVVVAPLKDGLHPAELKGDGSVIVLDQTPASYKETAKKVVDIATSRNLPWVVDANRMQERA